MKITRFIIALTLIILLSICVKTSSISAQTNQVTLKPIADAYVNSDESNSNYGGQSYLEVKNDQLNIGTTFYDFESITWLKFNLSSVPTEAKIEEVRLELHTSFVSETYNIQACYCSDDSWTELGITWTNMPTVGFISVDSDLVASDYQWYSWDVSEAINFAKINNDLTVVTIALIEPTTHESSFVWFYSKEGLFVLDDYSPKLTVQWSNVPSPTPTPTSTPTPTPTPTTTPSPAISPTPTSSPNLEFSFPIGYIASGIFAVIAIIAAIILLRRK